MTSTLDREASRVVSSGSCSGCGACCQLDDGLSMALDAQGFARPVRRERAPVPDARQDRGSAHDPEAEAEADADADQRSRAACPGVQVTALRTPGAVRHPTMGPALGVWRAWAADERVRHCGSSGGVLTALAGRQGESALIARTARGLQVVNEAVAAGVTVLEPIELNELAGVQPLQRNRRETLVGRNRRETLVGRTLAARLAGRRPPRYRGFGLLGLALRRPVDTLCTEHGTFGRVRRDRVTAPAPRPAADPAQDLPR